MENNKNNSERFGGSPTPRIWGGIVILAAGVVLLAYKMGAPIPAWVFTWPVLLIAIGTFTGLKSNFHNAGSFIMIAVGAIFLIDQTSPGLNFHNYIVPLILICVGLVYILRPKTNWPGKKGPLKSNWNNESPMDKAALNYAAPKDSLQEIDGEFVEINAAFGSVKKIILSKNFKGGEINCFMGGAEINLMKADLQNPVVLEVNNVFGGSKLIVPSNWDVKNQVSAVFGGIEDKRNITTSMPDENKVIILKGTCVFGGIEVTNY